MGRAANRKWAKRLARKEDPSVNRQQWSAKHPKIPKTKAPEAER